MDDPEQSPSIVLAMLQAQLALLERKERNAKRKDNFKLPSEVYETLEDLGKIQACALILGSLWHKEDEYRKASMHLSRLAWDLRKKLQEII